MVVLKMKNLKALSLLVHEMSVLMAFTLGHLRCICAENESQFFPPLGPHEMCWDSCGKNSFGQAFSAKNTQYVCYC